VKTQETMARRETTKWNETLIVLPSDDITSMAKLSLDQMSRFRQELLYRSRFRQALLRKITRWEASFRCVGGILSNTRQFPSLPPINGSPYRL